VSTAARRKFWGWGLEGDGLVASEIEQLGAVFTGRLGIDGVHAQEPPRVEELDLRTPRLVPPASLKQTFSTDPYDRAAHTYGRSFRDLVRAFRRDYVHAPDLVAFPRGEGELVSVLEWCSGAGVAAFRSAAVPAWSVESSPMSVTVIVARSASIFATCKACGRSTVHHRQRESRRARLARRWRRS
jgi:hypothetical protein